jgi:hypothetical protein
VPDKPYEIQLPKCPECGRVSSLNLSDGWHGKVTCGGATGTSHKKTRMIPTLFREVVPK